MTNVADFLLWCRTKFRVGPQPHDYCLRPDIGVSRSLTLLRPRLRRLADLKDTKRRLRHQASILIPSLVVPANADQEGGYGAAEKVMATDATAVFCHNDRTALGLYDALRELGKRVPDDISVVGFDNQEMISAHMHPALTTVGLPQYELGVMGVRTLLRQCGRNEDDGDEHVVTRTFEPIFVQCPAVSRDSVKRL